MKTFRCVFYEIPQLDYDGDDCLPEGPFRLREDTIDVYNGHLTVDLSDEMMEMGKFKTAHPGRLVLDNDVQLPPFTNRSICVKQIYRSRGEGKGIGRVKGRYELNVFSTECNCHRWASMLLDLTYKFVGRETNTRGPPPQPIPELRYTRTMVAVVQDSKDEKAFYIEEWIDTDEGDRQFVKYLNNRLPVSCLSIFAPPQAYNIAEFLIFAQHVQWQKTNLAVFTSDYQGAGRLLTDPQITSNPYVETS